MILGILSDTHGRAARAAAALRLLKQLGATALVHCGDVGGEAVFDELAGWRTWFVWGNTDPVDPGVRRYVEALGLSLPAEVPLRLELAGKVLTVFHGHEPEFARAELLAELGPTPALSAALGRCDYVLHGHTHVARDVRMGGVRVINPGALHRASVYTVATLDLARDEVAFWRVFDDGSLFAPVRWSPG